KLPRGLSAAQQTPRVRTAAGGARLQVLEISREPHEMNVRRPPANQRATPQPMEADELAKRQDPYNVKQASRIYFLPNLMTAGNLFCGFMAVINCIQARLAETALSGEYLGATPAEHYRYVVYFIFGAALFDSL